MDRTPTPGEIEIINAVFNAIHGQSAYRLSFPGESLTEAGRLRAACFDAHNDAVGKVADAVAEALRGLGFAIDFIPDDSDADDAPATVNT